MIHAAVRGVVAHYADDRPLSLDMEQVRSLIQRSLPPSIA